MEKGQSEVTHKIRSAIKQKLSEISDFVDDELPEYIMILVANQRSKSQIEKDLSLFLRKDTMHFTNWLWDLLNNLKVGIKNNQSPVQNDDSKVVKNDIEGDEDAVVLDFDPDEHEADFLLCENTNDSIISKSPVSLSPNRITEVKKESIIPKSTQNNKVIEKHKVKVNSPIKKSKKPSNLPSKELLSSAVVPVKRKLSNSEDEYDPAKPEYERARSNLNTRSYAGPAALQANKLLLKAVNDATKSILKGKTIEDYYKPTPIKVLSSKRTSDGGNSLSPNENNLCKKRKTSFQETKTESEAVVATQRVNPYVSEFNINEYPPDILLGGDTDYLIPSLKSRTIHLKSVPLVSDSIDFESNNYNIESSYSFEPIEDVRPKSPHFIVTLDGVNKVSFKQKFGEDNADRMEEEDAENDEDEILENETAITPEKKLKLQERCKYWPACKNSDQCLYHHPTVPCKCFPDCKFGDKCLYIHPNCKFDALCSRKDCPFTHASKRKLPLIIPVKMVPIKNRKMKAVCKFFPKCSAKNCPFIHPKLCRYGKECRLPSCLFSHFPVPSRSKMKWKASIS